ncbi:cytochrome c oxidase assembly protein [Aliiglaciecola sp. LCG003]|uniref:cytochrome c oxidase assembly protein n=1 Tax=Aliiglaciecola sp. LCG003 TaxID=3053655 RepID=UPI002574460D|nr:cytochrome c oxidase assembly protein [Aliiglaciecola sp. LCG003]WJG09344.1 cytochrome c oxidase assembly protein [Aliiglaciecola sp. LCG003]
MTQDTSTSQDKNGKLVIKLVAIVFGMFGFAFALVPLYEVFCQVTGLNGKTSDNAAIYESVEIDRSRIVTIEFITRTNTGMPWEFKAQTRKIEVYPGEMNQVDFYVKNSTTKDYVAQAIPSVSPGTAAIYINKTECFCFNHQPLAAGQEALMPMKFYVDPQLPKDITFFTLQYTLYDVTASAQDVAMNQG